MPIPGLSLKPRDSVDASSTAAPTWMGLKGARQAKPTFQSFAIAKADAEKIVALLKDADLFLGSFTVEWSEKKGWSVGEPFPHSHLVQVDFPSPLKSDQGIRYSRAMIDAKNGAFFLVESKEAREMDRAVRRFQKPPADLLGNPEAPQVSADGPFKLGKLRDELKVCAG